MNTIQRMIRNHKLLQGKYYNELALLLMDEDAGRYFYNKGTLFLINYVEKGINSYRIIPQGDIAEVKDGTFNIIQIKNPTIYALTDRIYRPGLDKLIIGMPEIATELQNINDTNAKSFRTDGGPTSRNIMKQIGQWYGTKLAR